MREGRGAAAAIFAAALTAAATQGCTMLTGADDLVVGDPREPSSAPLPRRAERAALPTEPEAPGEESNAGKTSSALGAGTIACGGATCAGAKPKCCFGRGASATCIAEDAPCDGLDMRCDQASDCPGGMICCGTALAFQGRTACMPASLCDELSGHVVCREAGDCSAGGKCAPFAVKPVVRTCQ